MSSLSHRVQHIPFRRFGTAPQSKRDNLDAHCVIVVEFINFIAASDEYKNISIYSLHCNHSRNADVGKRGKWENCRRRRDNLSSPPPSLSPGATRRRHCAPFCEIDFTNWKRVLPIVTRGSRGCCWWFAFVVLAAEDEAQIKSKLKTADPTASAVVVPAPRLTPTVFL